MQLKVFFGHIEFLFFSARNLKCPDKSNTEQREEENRVNYKKMCILATALFRTEYDAHQLFFLNISFNVSRFDEFVARNFRIRAMTGHSASTIDIYGVGEFRSTITFTLVYDETTCNLPVTTAHCLEKFL